MPFNTRTRSSTLWHRR